MLVPLHWTADTPDFFAASMDGAASKEKIFAVVELSVGGGWSWAAWSNGVTAYAMDGTTETRSEAMKAAECAVLAIRIKPENEEVRSEAEAV